MLIPGKSTARPVSPACVSQIGIWPDIARLLTPAALRASVETWSRRLAGGFAALATVAGMAMAQPAPPPPAQTQPTAQPQPVVPAPDPASPAGPAQGAAPPGTVGQGVPGAPAATRQSGAETPAIILDGSVADTLLGKPVKGLNGEDMGRLVDVMVDRSGMIRAAIVDFGGFLGVGTRKIAVDWRVLHFSKGVSMDAISADLSRDQLRTAPIYKPGEAAVIIGRADAAAAPPPAAPPESAGPPAQAPATPTPSSPAPSPPDSPAPQAEQKPQPQ